MKFWPSDSFVIETSMPFDEALAALQSEVEPKKLFRRSSDHTKFEGEVFQNGFRITRIIHYRNAFLPIITGRFSPGNTGTKVAIQLAMPSFVSAFLVVWLGGVGLAAVALTSEVLSGSLAPFPMLLFPVAMFLFGWALFSAGFWLEVRKQKPMLLELFRGVQSTGQWPN